MTDRVLLLHGQEERLLKSYLGEIDLLAQQEQDWEGIRLLVREVFRLLEAKGEHRDVGLPADYRERIDELAQGYLRAQRRV